MDEVRKMGGRPEPWAIPHNPRRPKEVRSFEKSPAETFFRAFWEVRSMSG
jgi:hypothetical protein